MIFLPPDKVTREDLDTLPPGLYELPEEQPPVMVYDIGSEQFGPATHRFARVREDGVIPEAAASWGRGGAAEAWNRESDGLCVVTQLMGDPVTHAHA